MNYLIMFENVTTRFNLICGNEWREQEILVNKYTSIRILLPFLSYTNEVLQSNQRSQISQDLLNSWSYATTQESTFDMLLFEFLKGVLY